MHRGYNGNGRGVKAPRIADRTGITATHRVPRCTAGTTGTGAALKRRAIAMRRVPRRIASTTGMGALRTKVARRLKAARYQPCYYYYYNMPQGLIEVVINQNVECKHESNKWCEKMNNS